MLAVLFPLMAATLTAAPADPEAAVRVAVAVATAGAGTRVNPVPPDVLRRPVPTSMPARLPYAELERIASAGRTVFAACGVDAPAGFVPADPIPGWPDGLYECFGRNGQAVMFPVTAAKVRLHTSTVGKPAKPPAGPIIGTLNGHFEYLLTPGDLPAGYQVEWDGGPRPAAVVPLGPRQGPLTGRTPAERAVRPALPQMLFSAPADCPPGQI